MNNSTRSLSPPQVHRIIRLNGSDLGTNFGWNLTHPGPTITVNSGDLVSMILNSADGQLHQWFIDFNNNSRPDPNETFVSPAFYHPTIITNYTFIPVIGVNVTRAGSWEYRCTYHPMFMYGIIIINQPPDFTISSNPSSLPLLVRQQASSTVTLASLGKFSGHIALTTITNSSLLSASLNATGVDLSEGNSKNVTVTVNGSEKGIYTVNVTGTSGLLARFTILIVSVATQDFTVSANPNEVTILAGQIGISSVRITSLNGFAGEVALAAIFTSPKISCSVQPANLTITTAGSSTLSCQGSAGTYTINMTATNSHMTHSATVAYNIQDFILDATPSSFTIPADSYQIVGITVKSLNGFSGSVNLTISINPAGQEIEQSSNAIFIPPNSSIDAQLNITTSQTTKNNLLLNYTVKIDATSGKLSHYQLVTFLVTPPSSNASTFAPTSQILVASGAATSTALATAILLIRRIRVRKQKSN